MEPSIYKKELEGLPVKKEGLGQQEIEEFLAELDIEVPKEKAALEDLWDPRDPQEIKVCLDHLGLRGIWEIVAERVLPVQLDNLESQVFLAQKEEMEFRVLLVPKEDKGKKVP